MLRLRVAQDTDCALLFAWANDSEVRQCSLRTEPIAWETHVAWFQQRQCNPACLLLIAEDEANTPVGQIRFDLYNDEAEVGISLDGRQRGKGYGPRLITQGISALLERAAIQLIHAWIKPDNCASQCAFERAGFHKEGLQPYHGLSLFHYTLQPLRHPNSNTVQTRRFSPQK